jgi:hypothetical protein
MGQGETIALSEDDGIPLIGMVFYQVISLFEAQGHQGQMVALAFGSVRVVNVIVEDKGGFAGPRVGQDQEMAMGHIISTEELVDLVKQVFSGGKGGLAYFDFLSRIDIGAFRPNIVAGGLLDGEFIKQAQAKLLF